ncbi:MAG: S-layer homology domain-containing protein [Lachnospiraceae bacterium]|nr:S-layer homology domain-containing protein [Lachnospiraceae bacterium]
MKRALLLKLLILIVALAFLGCVAVFAAVEEPRVDVVIESYDKTLAKGSVSASYFSDAVQKLGKENGLSVVIAKTLKEDEIYSINEITNNYINGTGKWLGFIIHNGKLIQDENFLNMALSPGDKVVLYYGSKTDTKIASNMDFIEKDSTLTVKIYGEQVVWNTDSGKVTSETIFESIKGAKVHLKFMDGREQVALTSDAGEAVFYNVSAGIYNCYAEGYSGKNLPLIVKTINKQFAFGINDPSSITRAEFSAVLAAYKNIVSSSGSIRISDISGAKYEKEITSLASNGYISGYSDGTFKPDKPISLLEGAVILSRFYESVPDYQAESGIPSWAGKSIATAKSNGILNGITAGYSEVINEELLIKLFLNMK